MRPVHFILFAVLVAALTGLTYLNALENQFLIWDDQVFVTENPSIRGLQAENLQWMLKETVLDHWHPLTWLSHAVVYYFTGLKPWWHHLTNVLLHCANALWFFLVAWVFMNLVQNRPLHDLSGNTLLAAGIAAILFGVHPQHVEIVAWVSARKDLLAVFFWFPAVLAYFYYVHATKKLARSYWYLLSLLFFLLSLSSKTMVLTLPVLLLLFDVYPLRRMILTDKSQWRGVVLEKIPFFMLALLLIAITLLGQEEAGVISASGVLNLEVRFMNSTNSILLYLGKLLLPVHFSPFYPFAPYRSFSENYLSLIPLLVILTLSVLALYAGFKGKFYWLLAWLFYLIALSPMAGFVQAGYQAAADRYAYLPTLPAYLLLGTGFAVLYQKQRLRPLLFAFTLITSSSLMLLSRQQNTVWHNDLGFWRYTLLSEPDNLFTQFNYAGALRRNGDYANAIAHYELILQRFGNVFPFAGDYYYAAAQNLAALYAWKGEHAKALPLYDFLIQSRYFGSAKQQAYFHVEKAKSHAALCQTEAAHSEAQKAQALGGSVFIEMEKTLSACQ